MIKFKTVGRVGVCEWVGTLGVNTALKDAEIIIFAGMSRFSCDDVSVTHTLSNIHGFVSR